MIGRDMQTWSDVELQRVADAERMLDGNGGWMDDDERDTWEACLQGTRCGGDPRLAQAVDAFGPHRFARFLRDAFGRPSHLSGHMPVSERFDDACRKHGNARAVRMIQDRARRILASRSLAQFPALETERVQP